MGKKLYMDTVGSIDIIDGSQYEVYTNSTTQASSDFDSIYEQKTKELTLDEIFDNVSTEYGVDVNLLKAVAQAESGFDTNAVSSCGAMGIMQLMPETANSLGVEDPFDAEQCITGGAKMLSYLLDDYNGNVTLALAAYNAGSGSVQKYGGVPPYNETINYIDKINNILGGALSNDSRTIAGTSATDLSSVSSSSVPDGNTNGVDFSNAIMGTGNVVVSISYDTVEDMLKAKAYESSHNESPLFSYEDYNKLLNTYKEVYERIVDSDNTLVNANTDNTNEAQSIDSDNEISSAIENIVSDNSSSQDTTDEVIKGAYLKNNAQVDNADMIKNLYEAQVAVVSPIMLRLYNN
jgi:hypothetical protein